MKALTTRSAPYGVALRNSIAQNGADVNYEAEVASIAVMDGDKILMGKRRDSGRWTLPGGHLEGGEDSHEGALRELREETGILAHQLNYLGSQGVITELGKTVMVHAYHLTTSSKATVCADPDQEVARWQWINVAHGLPIHIARNLHAKRNVTLMLLDIYRSFGGELYDDDLVKSRSHKYLRKYRGRTGEWVYVYHEGDAPGRQLKPEAFQHIRELGELGHEPSRQLLMSTQEHDEGKLSALRELSDLGHEPATTHLKHLGIDRKQERKTDEAEETNRQILGDNELTKPLRGQDLSGAQELIKAGVEREVAHLRAHSSTDVGRAFTRSGLTTDRIIAAVSAETSVTGKLRALHEGLKQLDRAIGTARSARTEIVSAGGYGNHIYNQVVHSMSGQGYLPSRTRDVHKRTTANQGGELLLPHAELRSDAANLPARRKEARETARRVAEEQASRVAAENAAAERRAADARRTAAEREQIGAAERESAHAVHSGNVDAIVEHMRQPLNDLEKKKLSHGLSKIFGDDFDFKKWLRDVQHPDPRIETRISMSLDAIINTTLPGYNPSISFGYEIRERESGRVICTPSRSVTRGADGSLTVRNGTFPRINGAYRSKYANLASAIYDGTESMVKNSSKNFNANAKHRSAVAIGCCANGGFGNGYKGAIVWAKHCYDFESMGYRNQWRDAWKQLLGSYGPRLGLTEQEISAFKTKVETFEYPYQFVEMGYGLSLEKMGRDVDDDIKAIVAKKGSYDLGSWLMQKLGTSWSAVNYVNQTDGRAGHLNQRREQKRARTRERSGSAPRARQKRSR